ncbi:ArsR/SmtB family transcription factor [Microlunatus soli]|uniref:ArsR/SmtB family transcription factor n=1 Tax=Microlunatus soli TaxID=630515 RepID=UPI0012FB5543|nr:helix-turn-helix domain-containing protein [Microlunatus soli]
MTDVMDPMWEVVGSVQMLQLDRGRRPPIFEPWVRRSRSRLRHRPTRSATEVLATIAPLNDYFPDFLTPDAPSVGLDGDLETVLSTPKSRLSSEIGQLGGSAPWLKQLADGRPETLKRLGDVVRHYFSTMIEPDRASIEGVLAANRTKVLRRMMVGGTEAVLDDLGPSMRWRSPYLECRYPIDKTVELNGRGLLLVPSYFCCRMPVMLADPHLSPVLVYPVEHPETEVGGRGIAELIGSTRAAVLSSVLDGASTSDVASRVGISLATASHHTGVLRGAGLITSTRRANRVVHAPSSLGLAMLDGEARL